MKANHTNSDQKKTHVHAQLCLTLCDLMDCSLLGSSVHGILQARLLEWVAISFSRDQTCVCCLAVRFLTSESPGKPKENFSGYIHSKLGFKAKNIIKDREGHFTMKTGLIQQEDTTTLNMY